MALPTFNLPFQGQDVPQPKQAPLDAGTQEMINTGVDRASRPGGEFAGEINKNIDVNAGALGQSSQAATQQGQQLGGADPNMVNALRQVYAAKAGRAIGQIKQSNQYAGEMQKADYMNKMAAVTMGQQRAATQNYSMLTDAYNKSEMARAQFISSIFQLAGTGMAIGAAQSRKPKQSSRVGGQSYAESNYGSGGGGGYGDNTLGSGNFGEGGGSDMGSIA